MIVVGVWFAGVWQNADFVFISKFAVGLACVLFVLIFFQGRFFWKDQVDHISGDGEYFEAVTSIWVGRGKRIAFGPQEAIGWTSRPRTTTKPGEPDQLGTIAFKVKGTPLEMSFVNPKVIDLEAMTSMNPAYFAKVKADYPTLQSVG